MLFGQITNIKSERKPKLLIEVKQKMRTSSYSEKTIEAYLKWIKEYIVYNNKQHPSELNKRNVENFLTYLAVKRNVSASTQNQALSAILYLYQNVLETELGWFNDVVKQGTGIISPLDRNY